MRRVRRAQENIVIAAVASIPEVKAKMDELRAAITKTAIPVVTSLGTRAAGSAGAAQPAASSSVGPDPAREVAMILQTYKFCKAWRDTVKEDRSTRNLSTASMDAFAQIIQPLRSCLDVEAVLSAFGWSGEAFIAYPDPAAVEEALISGLCDRVAGSLTLFINAGRDPTEGRFFDYETRGQRRHH